MTIPKRTHISNVANKHSYTKDLTTTTATATPTINKSTNMPTTTTTATKSTRRPKSMTNQNDNAPISDGNIPGIEKPTNTKKHKHKRTRHKHKQNVLYLNKKEHQQYRVQKQKPQIQIQSLTEAWIMCKKFCYDDDQEARELFRLPNETLRLG